MQKLNAIGSFEARVQQPDTGWFGETPTRNTPYLRLPLVVTSGPYAGHGIAWFGWLTDAAQDNTIQKLTEAFGFDGDLVALHEGRSTLANLECQIVTELDTYNGKSECRVAWLNPPGGKPAAVQDAAKLSSLLQAINGRSRSVAKDTAASLGAQPQPRAIPSGQTTTGRTPSDDGDDVPF